MAVKMIVCLQSSFLTLCLERFSNSSDYTVVRLLQKISFDKNVDHLVLTGDMISKGPDSLGVINLARNIGASCVRGNHEDRVLLVYAELNARRVPLPGPEEPVLLENDEMEEESF